MPQIEATRSAEDERGPGSSGELARALERRADEAGERWLEALRTNASVARRPFFAQPARAPDLRRVAAWILGPGGGRIPNEVRDVLHTLVDPDAGGRGFAEDLHREFHLLSEVLQGVLEEEAGRLGADVPPGNVATVAGRVNRAVLRALGVAAEILDERRRGERTRALEAFGSTVRHELRNPLGAAQAAAQLLREDGAELPPERYDRVLQSLERSVRGAVDVLGAVTTLSHGGPPDTVDRWEPLDAVLHRVVEVAGREAGDVAVELVGEVPSLKVDADRIAIAVHNLVENAVKYRDPAREASWVRVRVERDDEGRRWWIRVRDNGLGIAEDELESVFQRFYRAGDGEARGSGLGLSIVREAARQMGCEVQVDSRVGEGSSFSICVPDARTRPAG